MASHPPTLAIPTDKRVIGNPDAPHVWPPDKRVFGPPARSATHEDDALVIVERPDRPRGRAARRAARGA